MVLLLKAIKRHVLVKTQTIFQTVIVTWNNNNKIIQISFYMTTICLHHFTESETEGIDLRYQCTLVVVVAIQSQLLSSVLQDRLFCVLGRRWLPKRSIRNNPTGLNLACSEAIVPVAAI